MRTFCSTQTSVTCWYCRTQTLKEDTLGVKNCWSTSSQWKRSEHLLTHNFKVPLKSEKETNPYTYWRLLWFQANQRSVYHCVKPTWGLCWNTLRRNEPQSQTSKNKVLKKLEKTIIRWLNFIILERLMVTNLYSPGALRFTWWLTWITNVLCLSKEYRVAFSFSMKARLWTATNWIRWRCLYKIQSKFLQPESEQSFWMNCRQGK